MSGWDKTKIRNAGPGHITLDGITDLGLIGVEGFKWTPVGGMVEVHTSRTGPHVPETVFHEGQGIEFEMVLEQTEFDILEKVWALTKRVSGSGKEKLDIGVVPGTPVPEYELLFQSTIAARTPDTDFTIFGAIFDSQPPQQFFGGKEVMWLVKGKGVMQTTGLVASLGDQSTVQGVAASVSAVVPANAAVGQAVGTDVTATITKDLNRDTINIGNVRLYKNVAGNLTEVAGAVGGVNAGAATTIVFNPTSDLDALSQYVFIIGSPLAQSDIYDLDGNRIVHFDSEFTTA